MQDEPAAFGLWLKRDLKQRYSAVAREPLSDELLSLIDSLPLQD